MFLLPKGVSVQGGLPPGVSASFPPVNRQTGVKTLPSLAVGNNTYDIEYPNCHNCLAKNGHDITRDDIIQKGLL